MDQESGDKNHDAHGVLRAEGPYDPKKDPTLTKQDWNYIKRIKYDYYLMDKEVLAIIEQRERDKIEQEEEVQKMAVTRKEIEDRLYEFQNKLMEIDELSKDEGIVEDDHVDGNKSSDSDSAC